MTGTAESAFTGTMVEAPGALNYGGQLADVVALGRFALEVGRLQSMDVEGLVRVTGLHHETRTGQRFVVRVEFTRLRAS
jgi:hypothetical protein